MLDTLKRMFNEPSVQEESPIVVGENGVAPTEEPTLRTPSNNDSLDAVKARVAASRTTKQAPATQTANAENDPVAAAMASITEGDSSIQMDASDTSTPAPSKMTMPEKYDVYKPPISQNSENESPSQDAVEHKDDGGEKEHLATMARLREVAAKKTGAPSPVSIDLGALETGTPVKEELPTSKVDAGTSEIEETLRAIQGASTRSVANDNNVTQERDSDSVEVSETKKETNPATETISEEREPVTKEIETPSSEPAIPAFNETQETNTPLSSKTLEETSLPVEVPKDTVEVEEPTPKVESTQILPMSVVSKVETNNSESLLAPTEREVDRILEEVEGNSDSERIKEALAAFIASDIYLEETVGDLETRDGRPVVDILKGLAIASARKQQLAKAVDRSQGIRKAA